MMLSNDKRPPASEASHSVSLFDSILNARSLHETDRSVSRDDSDQSTDVNRRNNKASIDPRMHVEKLLLMRKYVMKLGDFGHCCRFDERHVVEEGATRYCARELIRMEDGPVDLYKTDIFSLGALVYELCLGRWIDKWIYCWMDG